MANPLIHFRDNLSCLDLSCHGLTIGGITLPQSQSGIEKKKKERERERESFQLSRLFFRKLVIFPFTFLCCLEIKRALISTN